MKKVSKKERVSNENLEEGFDYRSLIDSQNDLILYVSNSAIILFVNKAFTKFCGKDFSEVLGRKFEDFVAKDSVKDFLSYLERFNKKSYDDAVFDLKMFAKDGEIIWFSWRMSAIFEKSRFKGFVLQGREVDALKNKMLCLEIENEKYNDVYNNATIGFYRSRLEDGMILECNTKFANQLGFEKREDCIGNYKFENAYVDRGLRELCLNRLNKYGYVNNFEIQIKDVNNKKIWMTYSARIFKDKSYVEGVAIDISKRKFAEFALQDSEKMYRSLFDAVPVAISISDVDGTILDCNKLMLDMSEYILEEIRKVDLSVFFADVNDFLRFQRLLMREGKIRNFEVDFVDKKGERFSVSLSVDFIELNGQKFMRTLLTDISNVKEMEKKLLDSYKHLAFINRQVSILLEVHKKTGVENTDEILAFILESAISLSASIGVTLYKAEDNKLKFVSGIGSAGRGVLKASSIKKGEYGVFDEFCKTKERMQVVFEKFKEKEQKKLGIYQDNLDLLILPLKDGDDLRGVLCMTFDNIHKISTQELNFNEAFALHTFFVLGNMGIV